MHARTAAHLGRRNPKHVVTGLLEERVAVAVDRRGVRVLRTVDLDDEGGTSIYRKEEKNRPDELRLRRGQRS